MATTRTQVAIIGGGPAGMMLSHILHRHGIDSIVLERQSRDDVLGRIRTGLLEHNNAQLLRDYGLADRMAEQAIPKDGTRLVWDGRDDVFIDVRKWTGQPMLAWPQTQITEDLYAARERDGGQVVCEVGEVALHDLTTDPFVTFTGGGRTHRIDCDFIAGCDGLGGPSWQSIPNAFRRSFEQHYPFSWLSITVEKPPLEETVPAYHVFACHTDGMALASQRDPAHGRYYLQVSPADTIEEWSDDRIWATLLRRFPKRLATRIATGASVEKSISARHRNAVSEPLRFGKLFIAGDAGHIVPPTCAKGLNLALSDAALLGRAFTAFYDGGSHYLDRYSHMALRRAWSAVNLSRRLTSVLHVLSGDPFEQRIRESDYDLLAISEPAQRALAHEYAGLPLES